MSWFYDKQATFKNADGDIDSDGLYSNSATVETLTVDCDLQPVSRDDLIDDSGHFIDAQYKIFALNTKLKTLLIGMIITSF